MPALTKERIVTAARAMVESVGHDGLSARKLAAELGVTAPALYDHVRSLDEVLAAVAATGYDDLARAYDDLEGERPIDRVRARGLAYVQFACTRPELFRLMFLFRPAAIAIEADNELAAATTVFDEATEDIGRAVADGDIVDRPVEQMALTLWSAMHGVATIATYAPDFASSIADDVIDTLLAGLRPVDPA